MRSPGNLQGDIVGLLDSTGVLTVEYRYDAWGKPISTTGDLANTLGKRNPFRYRGYVYDEETGLYYAISRFYSPQRGQFITCDNIDVLLSNLDSRTDKNLWCYCDNNPVVHKDSDGNFWLTSVLAGVATQYIGDVIGNIIAGETGMDILKPASSVGEYIAAGVTAIIPGQGAVGALVRNAVSEGICIAEQRIKGEEINAVDSIVSITAGTVLDVEVGKISNKAVSYISSKAPKNYSSYAYKVRKSRPARTNSQIRRSMQRSIRWNCRLSKATMYAFDIGRTCLPY